MRRSLVTAALALLTAASLTACSVLSPEPLLELVKATGTAASGAIALGPSSAKNVVYHPHRPIYKLCIEFNPQSQAADMVPAIQVELQTHMIESRVYEAGSYPNLCGVWLNYVAHVEWGIPPFSSDYRTYLTTATLTLRDSSGQVLSSSSYELDPNFGMGKWTSTRTKLSPVVTALITGP